MIIVVSDSNTTNRKDFLMCSKAITTKYNNTNVNLNPSYKKFELDQGCGICKEVLEQNFIHNMKFET